MEELLQRLQAIKNEVLTLKTRSAELQKQADKAEKDNQRLRQLLEIQNSSIKQMEQKLKVKRIADGVSGNEDGESNRELKFKINDIIKEVDRVISLMHQ